MTDSRKHREALEIFLETSKVVDALESDNRETQSAKDNIERANNEMIQSEKRLREIKEQRRK